MIKSQDDCSKELKPRETRSVDVLVEAISKLETTTKQLAIAVKALKDLTGMTFERYLVDTRWGCVGKMRKTAEQALNKIKELER